jgi:hypothetical protein
MGGIPDETEENFSQKRLSKKQRIGKKEALLKSKEAQERDKFLEQVKEAKKMLLEGNTERDITRKFSITRWKQEKQQEFWVLLGK